MVGMSKAKMENRAMPKRFYQQAATRDGRIFLDGKELKTQARSPLVIPQPVLAEAVAAEWNAQAEHINPDLMPLTRLVNLAIDRTATDREALIANAVNYIGTDLLCYRSPELAARQAALFDPVLIWAAGQGIRLDTTEGLMPIDQPEASLIMADSLLREADDWELTALAMMVPLLGSAVLALALWKHAVTLEDALAMTRLDETAQAEQWGVDAEAEAMWSLKKRDIEAASFFLRTLRA